MPYDERLSRKPFLIPGPRAIRGTWMSSSKPRVLPGWEWKKVRQEVITRAESTYLTAMGAKSITVVRYGVEYMIRYISTNFRDHAPV